MNPSTQRMRNVTGKIILLLLLALTVQPVQSVVKQSKDPTGTSDTTGGDPDITDSDGDGLTDSEEETLETNPYKPDTDGDTLTDYEDAVPLDAEINWSKSPENRYVWLGQVMGGGAKAVSRHGHILFPYSNYGSNGINLQHVLWDSATSSFVTLTGASSWSNSGFISGNNPDVFDAEWMHIDDMNDEGMVVGRSEVIGPYEPVAWVLASAIMKWQMISTATDQYADPIYIVPGFQYVDPWDDLEEALYDGEDNVPRIADDGTISAVSWFVEAGNLPPSAEWVASGTQLTDHSKEMAAWAFFDMDWNVDIPYRSGAVIGATGGLLVEHHPNIPKTILHYRNGADAESLEGLLPSTTYGITDTDIGRTPATSESSTGRIWFSVNHTGGDAAFLEKRAGGSGVSRWHNPPSMAEGAIRLNAQGLAITGGKPATQTAAAIPPKLWRNGKYTDLNELTSKPETVTITQAIDLASNGIILAQATDNGVTKTGLLMPANVAVDANRDGVITFDEKDETTAQNPYEFWVNHDRDIGHTVDGNDWEEDDVQGNETSVTWDIFEPGLKWRRDLADLTRIRIDLSVIETVLDTNDANLKLYARMEPSDGDPQVTLYQPVETDGERKYLTDDNIGYNQTQSYYGDELCTAVNTPEGNEMPRRAWQSLPSNKALHLLFEGKWQGKGKLIFEFRMNGEVIAKMPPVFLDLKKVEDMYETWTVGDVPYSGTQYGYWPAATALKTTGQNLPTPQTSQEKDYFLFVHGWNMSPFDKDVYAATAFKRLWHQGYKGRFGSFRWPTFFDLLSTDHFDGSEQRAWNSGVPLAGLVSQLSLTFQESGQSKVRLYAHSMGNIVASECLRQLSQASKVHTYISAQAAISSHVWDATTPLMQFPIGLGPDTPDVYGYYWQTGATSRPHEWQEESRPSYMHSSYMPNSVFYINHYNPSDWALSFGIGWQDNQMLKPNVGYHYSIINPFDLTDLKKRFWKDQATKLNFPDDRFEIFSFAAESHSYATGQQGSTGGMFGAAVNLNDMPFSFGGAHKGHSAQFRSTIQRRWTYWELVLNDMLVTTP